MSPGAAPMGSWTGSWSFSCTSLLVCWELWGLFPQTVCCKQQERGYSLDGADGLGQDLGKPTKVTCPEMERVPKAGHGAEPSLASVGRSGHLQQHRAGSLPCSHAPDQPLPLGSRVPSSPAKMALAGGCSKCVIPSLVIQSPKQISCKTLRQNRGYAPRAAHCWTCPP